MSRVSHIPFIGRLYLSEYLALGLSFALLFLETVVRSITLLLPGWLIRLCYRLSRNAFNSLSSPYSRRARNRKKSVSSPIAQAQDFVELCALYGYYAEEHIVQTKDGYLLGVHRLGWRQGEEEQRVNAGPGSITKRVAYLHHGLLMNSEVWVCATAPARCLPFALVDRGYDVWLGNNRGNKYSKKCLHRAPTDPRFWDFSMDQFAFHDIPDTIAYVLATTHQPDLSYIGFSQGSAQAFAALSIHPTLNRQVSVFVALAPAMAPPGLASGTVASLCKSNPELLFLAFGRRAILGSATMWQALLYPAIFGWCIDKALAFLFNWQTANITPHQKLAAYPHLYSFTSTKSVVHWFQIIRNGTFQMYDDEVTTPLALGNGSKYYKVAKFPTRNIKTPIVLLYGGSDSLVDIKLMLKELPKHTVAKCIPKYEHLDFLWASDVDRLVFPHVLEALSHYAVHTERTKPAALGWRGTANGVSASNRTSVGSGAGSLPPPGYEEDSEERGAPARAGMDGASAQSHRSPPADFDFGFTGVERVSTGGEQLDETDDEDGEEEEDDAGPERFALTRSQAFIAQLPVGNGVAVASGGVQVGARSATLSEGGRTVPSPKRARILSPRIRAQQKLRAASLNLTTPTPTPPTTASTSEEKKAGSSSPQNTTTAANPLRTSQQSASEAARTPPRHQQNFSDAGTASPLASGFTGTSQRSSRPEGWWSSASSGPERSPSVSRARARGRRGSGADDEEGEEEEGGGGSGKVGSEGGGRVVRRGLDGHTAAPSRVGGSSAASSGIPLPATTGKHRRLGSEDSAARGGGGNGGGDGASGSPVSVVRRQRLEDEGSRRRESDASGVSERGSGLVKGKAGAAVARVVGVGGGSVSGSG
ncbi:hypothetical protein LTR08_006859 [Meristemomyces frigidus]|nr:hypothetical protein LTR08_006859 [Meristemomyces frigidus]